MRERIVALQNSRWASLQKSLERSREELSTELSAASADDSRGKMAATEIPDLAQKGLGRGGKKGLP